MGKIRIELKISEKEGRMSVWRTEKINPRKTRSSWNTSTASGLKRTRGLRMSSLGERETVELAKNCRAGEEKNRVPDAMKTVSDLLKHALERF